MNNPFKRKKPQVEEEKAEINGGRNLVILGVISIGIALLTTAVSIYIYHHSGDIYLDRSRPGFLPDEEEIEQLPNSVYKFPENGTLTEDSIKEYIENFEQTLDQIDNLEAPFSNDPLSDKALGIDGNPPTSGNI